MTLNLFLGKSYESQAFVLINIIQYWQCRLKWKMKTHLSILGQQWRGKTGLASWLSILIYAKKPAQNVTQKNSTLSMLLSRLFYSNAFEIRIESVPKHFVIDLCFWFLHAVAKACCPRHLLVNCMFRNGPHSGL